LQIPRGQVVYTDVSFDSFTDDDGVEVSQDDSASVAVGAGVTVEHMFPDNGVSIFADGIHESAETLADYFQEHAGFHFTLGLVEAQVHLLPKESYVVQPRILARTVNIERGIVRIEDGRPVVVPVPSDTKAARESRNRMRPVMERRGLADPFGKLARPNCR
jgi:hypothetical protein